MQAVRKGLNAFHVTHHIPINRHYMLCQLHIYIQGKSIQSTSNNQPRHVKSLLSPQETSHPPDQIQIEKSTSHHSNNLLSNDLRLLKRLQRDCCSLINHQAYGTALNCCRLQMPDLNCSPAHNRAMGYKKWQMAKESVAAPEA